MVALSLQAQVPIVQGAQNAGSVNPAYLLQGDRMADAGQAVDVDRQGNVYVAGWLTGMATFGITTLVSSGEWELFVAKYNNLDKVVRAMRAKGTANSSASGNGIRADAQGQVYVTGE